MAMLCPLLGSRLSAEEAVIKKVDSKGLRLPWHTTDLYWNNESSVADVKTIGASFTVEQDVPDTVNLYIAPLGGQYLNEIMFYGGIQTNVNGWPSPEDRRRVHPGPGAIFSRWGGEPVSIDAAKPVAGGLCESAGYEGEFVSVRKPLRWKAGTYTWELRKETTVVIDDQPQTWFACFLKDHDRDQEFRIGALRFEGKVFKFNGRSTSFVEIYSTSKIPRSGVPEITVTFEPPVINGRKTSPQSVLVYHPRKGDRGSASPALGRAKLVNRGVQVKLYNEVQEGDKIPPKRYTLTMPTSSE